MIHGTAMCVFFSLTLFCVLFESFGEFRNLYNLTHDLFRVLCAVF